MWNPSDPSFLAAIFAVALFYSMVGHGGASGYLALMSFTLLAGRPASTLALVMNLGVAGVSFFSYHRAKHFDLRLAWPFFAGSTPCAFLGGKLHVPGDMHKWLISLSLVCAAAWLLWGIRQPEKEASPCSPWAGVLCGAVLGLVSGMIGIGGGIFLSPLLILSGWAGAKTASSTSAVFILLNSIAGLAARSAEDLQVVPDHGPLILAAVAASVAGSLFGAFRATSPQLKTALGVVLVLAAVKLALG